MSVNKIFEQGIKILFELCSNGEQSKVDNLIYLEKEFLNRDMLIEISKEHIVRGANAVAVTKSAYAGKGKKLLGLLSKDLSELPEATLELISERVITIFYLHDNELIDTSRNCFVNIRTETLSRDVDDLFNGKDCVVLK